MRPIDIHKQVRSTPFVPMRLHFSDGSSIDVRHPEFIAVTRIVLGITVPGPSENELPERVILCDPLHVVRLEPINGQDS